MVSAMCLRALSCLYAAAVVVEATACEGPEPTCAVRVGAAMLQTSADKSTASTSGKKGDDVLEGRAATISAEIESLTNRVSIIMTTVGIAAGAELLDKSKKPYEKYAALLHSKYDDAALKEVVTDLEAKAMNLKSNVKALETEVSGAKFDAALLERASKKSQLAGESLTSRIVALEELVTSLRDRVTALEQKVSLGLLQRESSMMQMTQVADEVAKEHDKVSAASLSKQTAATKDAPLKGRLATIESEITALQDRVANLETEVGAASAAAFLQKGSEDKAEDLKSRVAVAEANVGTLKSKIATLQNQVLGGMPQALLQSDVKGSSLNARIISLEEDVNRMRTDASDLEHTVMG